MPLVEVDERDRLLDATSAASSSSATSSGPGACSATRSSCAARWSPATAAAATLGFPTANLVPDEALVYPGHGVYAASPTDVPAAVSVGVRPTFGTGRAVLVEAFLIDFDGDLYGTELRLDFLARLRGERALRDRRGAGRADGRGRGTRLLP